MKRAGMIIAVLLIGLVSGCGDDDDVIITSDVLGYVDIDTSEFFDDRAPALAFDGTNYLVVYEDLNLTIVPAISNHNIIGVFVSPDPAIGAGTPFVIDIDNSNFTNDDLAPAVAFDKTNSRYLVVYQRETSPTNHDIFGALVDSTTGAVIGNPFPIDNDPSNDDIAPAVAFDKTTSTYLVVYQRVFSTDSDIQGAIVNATGTSITLFPIDDTLNIDDVAPSVASNGANYLVVYQRTINSTNHGIRGAIVDPTGPTVSLFGIDTTGFDDRVPRVAFDGVNLNYLVVYEETVTSTNHDIIGALVSTSGTGVGGGPITPFVIDDTTNLAGVPNDDRVPNVAFDGTNYLVVYQDLDPSFTDHDIIGARVDLAGNVLDFVFIDTSECDDLVPAVAFGATNFLVAYEEVACLTATHDIFGALVRP